MEDRDDRSVRADDTLPSTVESEIISSSPPVRHSDYDLSQYFCDI